MQDTEAISITRAVAESFAATCGDPDSPVRVLLEILNKNKGKKIKLFVPRDVAKDVRDVIDYSTSTRLPPYPATYCRMLESRKRWDVAAMFLGNGLTYPPPNSDPSALRFMDALPEHWRRAAHEDLVRRNRYATPDAVGHPFLDLVEVPETIETLPHGLDLRRNALISGSACPKADWQAPSTDGLRGATAWMKRVFSGVPWFGSKGNETHGIVVAGGSIASALLGRPSGRETFDERDTFDEQVFEGFKFGGDIGITETPPGDIDVFVCDTDVGSAAAAAIERAHETYRRLLDSVERFAGEAGFKVAEYVRENVVDLTVCKEKDDVKFKVQVILRLFETPSHVLFGFDYSVCKFLFDGERTWATRAALDMLQTGVALLDANKMSKSGIFRAAKYLARYWGLHMMVPGVPQEVIDALELLAYHIAWDSQLRLKASLSSTIGKTSLNFVAALNAYDAKHDGPSKRPATMPGSPWISGAVQKKYTGIMRLLVEIGQLHSGSPFAAAASDYDRATMDIIVNRKNVDVQWRILTQDCFTGAMNPLPQFNLYADLGEETVARFLRSVGF